MNTAPLQDRDYTIIVARTATDDSSKPPGFAERWTSAQDAILALVKRCEEFDPDGVTVYVAQACSEDICKFQKHSHIASSNLIQVIEENYPPYRINLQSTLQAALNDYFDRKAAGQTKKNGEIIVVLLDGEPLDRMAVAKVIKAATHKMDVDQELGIGFVQIGEDLIAKGFLTALDENLKGAGAKFDIVHTKLLDQIEPASLTDFLLSILYN